MLALFLAATLQTVAVPAAAAPLADDENTITVTGVRIEDLAAAVDRCRQSTCPTRRDIVATIRYAEALFRTGDYRRGRSELKAGIGRVKHAASAEPVAVSQLYYALATLTAHEGDQRDHAAATFASARVLRAAFPDTAPEVLFADLRVGDLALRNGLTVTAHDRYESIARRANASGQPEFAAAADMRRAALFRRSGRKAESARLLAEIAARPGPELAPMRQAALVQAARDARADGDLASTQRLLATMIATPSSQAPMLIYEPPAPQPGQLVPSDPFLGPVDVQTRSGDIVGLRWVDIGFWIRGDGRVEDAEVLRGSRELGWAAPLVRMISGRRYTPFTDAVGAAVPPLSSGQYHIERYSFTADYQVPTTSLIRRRVANPRFERLDLTETAPSGP
jgi:hypothetical protein